MRCSLLTRVFVDLENLNMTNVDFRDVLYNTSLKSTLSYSTFIIYIILFQFTRVNII